MQEPTITELSDQLGRALLSADKAMLTAVFERLAMLDGYRIAKRARSVLEALSPEVLDRLGDDPLERAHKVTMSAFRASVLSYFEEKSASVEPSVRGDITAWIDANAGAIASVNLQIMEDAISQAGTTAAQEAHSGSAQQLARFRQLVDQRACEHHQQRILRDIWAGIETAIADLLSADFS